jgi:hypothetical protein
VEPRHRGSTHIKGSVASYVSLLYTNHMQDIPPDINQYDQSALQSLLAGSSPSLIPESLITTLTIAVIVMSTLGILFMVFYVLSMVRKWKMESAMIHMQKDVADIKALLASPSASPAASQPPVQPVAPTQSSNTIAQSDDSFNSPSVT